LELSKREMRDGYRWVVLGSYMIVAAVSQLLWLNFASITTPIMTGLFNVSEQSVGLLSALWPLIFIPFSIPAGLLTDSKGFKPTVTIGALIMAFFSVLRILSGRDFVLLLLFQSAAGVGQPFVYAVISKLVIQWFPTGERGLATGLATLGQFVGMGVALVVTPLLVSEASMSQFRTMLIVYALISVMAAILFISLSKESPQQIEGPVQAERTTIQLKGLLRSREFVVLMALFFIGVGFFTGLLTWTESALVPRRLTVGDASLVAGLIIIGGIFGSVLIPWISDRIGRRKPFFLLNFAVSALALLVLSFSYQFIFLALAGLILGFFLVSTLPIGLDYSSQVVGEALTGTAQSLLWLVAQVGAVALITVMGSMANFSLYPTNPFLPSMILITVLDVVALGLSATVREVRR
jgi:nitrate/nitrite transporter NarK